MAKKSIPVAQSSTDLLAELNAVKARSRDNVDRNAKTSILIDYMYAIADILTTASHDEDLTTELGDKTLVNLQWLQLELADQAGAVLNGYMPTSIPSYEQPWVMGKAPE